MRLYNGRLILLALLGNQIGGTEASKYGNACAQRSSLVIIKTMLVWKTQLGIFFSLSLLENSKAQAEKTFFSSVIFLCERGHAHTEDDCDCDC